METNGVIYPENEDNPPSFRIIEGGKSLPKTKWNDIDDNWLRKLPPGRVFLARPRAGLVVELGLYQVLGHAGLATQLSFEGKNTTFVDSLRFSGMMEKIAEVADDGNAIPEDGDRSD